MSTKFILVGAGRSGTTLYIDSLKQRLNCFGEVFGKYWPSLDFELFDGNFTVLPEDSEKFLNEEQHGKICRKKYCVNAHKKYDGYKLLYDHIQNDVHEYLNQVKIIHLIRRNKLSCVTSWHAARKNNQWFNVPFLDRLYLNPSVIRGQIQQIIDYDIIYNKYADLTIYYEDDFQHNINKICTLLHIPIFNPVVTLTKSINRTLSDIIINYEELKSFDSNIARL
jgi:hypothetical protein